MSTPLETAIFRTVNWFSLFDYPLTSFEIWKWLYAPGAEHGLEEVVAALDESAWLSERIVRREGMVFLRSDAGQQLPELRRERFLDAVRKLGKLRRVARLMGALPGVEAAAAANTLAWFHTRPESDIDLYIAVRPGTIWQTRLLLVLPFALLNRRPGTEGAVDTFCFSFFADTESLALEPLALPHGDPYLAYWTASLIPLLDRARVWERSAGENGWVRGILPNAGRRTAHRRIRVRGFRRFLPASSLLERAARAVQMRRLPAAIRERANQDTCVIVNDRMLKFHVNDRREQYRRAWEASYDA